MEPKQDAAWWKWYAEYLKSPEWDWKRRLVLERDDHLCQCCLAKDGTQVHHLTYAHVGEERLWELQTICDGCHDRITGDDRQRRTPENGRQSSNKSLEGIGDNQRNSVESTETLEKLRVKRDKEEEEFLKFLRKIAENIEKSYRRV